MKNKLLVSILIANYNKEKYIDRGIKSCLKQTYKNIEIIFVDDSSNDNSFNEAKKFKKIKVFKKKRIKFKQNFNTFFQIETYLYAFKKSSGEIIFFLDADDFFLKNKVFKIVKYFKKNPHTQILFDNPIIYYAKNNFHYDNFYLTKRKNPWPKFPPQSCIAIRRSFFKKILNEIVNKNFYLLTLDFRLAAISYFAFNNYENINDYLTFYYQDPAGETNNKFKKFSVNWWLRRRQAHDYCRYLLKKYSKKKKFSLDSLLTTLITNILKLLCKL